MDTAESDDFSIGFLRVIGETQRVSHKIGDILNHADLVVVGKDHRISLGLEAENLFPEIECWRSSGHSKRIADEGVEGKEEIVPSLQAVPTGFCWRFSDLFPGSSGRLGERYRCRSGWSAAGLDDPLGRRRLLASLGNFDQ